MNNYNFHDDNDEFDPNDDRDKRRRRLKRKKGDKARHQRDFKKKRPRLRDNRPRIKKWDDYIEDEELENNGDESSVD